MVLIRLLLQEQFAYQFFIEILDLDMNVILQKLFCESESQLMAINLQYKYKTHILEMVFCINLWTHVLELIFGAFC